MNELSEISVLVKEYVSPETVWLVPCLYALGSIIKRSIRIDDTLIPGILCLVGVLLVGTGERGCLRAGRLDAVGNANSCQHRTRVCAGGGCHLPQSAD